MGWAMLCLRRAARWCAVRCLKKRGGLRMFGVGTGVQIENRVSLGPKKNLLVVRAHGKRLLFGVTDHHISRLADLPLEDDGEDDDANRRTGRKQPGPQAAWPGAARPGNGGGRQLASGPGKPRHAPFSGSLHQVLTPVGAHHEHSDKQAHGPDAHPR